MKKNIAIFASGSGTNAENIIRYFQQKESAQVSLMLTNRKEAPVRERAARLHVPCHYIPKAEWETEENVMPLLREYDIHFIVLAGFLLKVPDYLLQAYPHRILNIHPALLPKFGGKGMYGDHVHRAVVEAGETETGITIHYIDEEYDKGETLFQARCTVLPTDTPEMVAAKVHALEYEHFPKVIESLL